MRRRNSVLVLALVAGALSTAACDGRESEERPRDPSAGFGAREGDKAPESRYRVFSVAASRIPAKLLRGASESWELETDGEVKVIATDDESAADRFCAGDVPLVGITRRLTPAERQICRANGIRPRTARVGYHGVAVAASEELEVGCLTQAELRRLWRSASPVGRLEQLRAGLPDRAPVLLGSQPRTRAFELFTRRVTGRAGLRADYVPVEDLAVLVERLAQSRRALGFYDLGLLISLRGDDLATVAVDWGSGCVRPSASSIQAGRYEALAEPVYVHLDGEAFDRRREVRSYLEALFASYSQFASSAPPLVELRPARVARAARALGVQPGSAGGEPPTSVPGG